MSRRKLTREQRERIYVALSKMTPERRELFLDASEMLATKEINEHEFSSLLESQLAVMS